MPITFQSRATGDIIMLVEPARQLLAIIGKDGEASKGIITLEQLPQAIATLASEIENDRRLEPKRQAELEKQLDEDPNAEPPPSGMAAPVSLAQRGWPLLEMMRTSLKEGFPITWES